MNEGKTAEFTKLQKESLSLYCIVVTNIISTEYDLYILAPTKLQVMMKNRVRVLGPTRDRDWQFKESGWGFPIGPAVNKAAG